MAVAAKKSPAPGPRAKNVVAAARGRGKPPRAAGPGAGPALWDNVKSILGALLIFLVIRAFLVEAFRIPSGSMIPTLLVGDWLFVNKLVYGPHVPFTDARLPGYADPQRGDVVVFVSPPQSDQPEDPQPTLVKRLVGVPGDTLFMRDAVLYVNGVPRPQGPDFAANEKGDPNEVNPLFDWQKAYALGASRFGAAPAQPTHDRWGPIVVPAAHYFMLGDNRYCSKDSRYWGFVPRENIRGRPLFVYYSYRAGGDAESSDVCNPDQSTDAFPWLTDIRWSRIGHRIR